MGIKKLLPRLKTVTKDANLGDLNDIKSVGIDMNIYLKKCMCIKPGEAEILFRMQQNI